MARTRIVGDKVLFVDPTLVRRIPGVVAAATGVTAGNVASATGATVYVSDPRSPWDKAIEGSIQNTDGATASTWDFAALSGLKMDTGATIAAAAAGELNKPAGKFIVASGGATYTLTNSFISATSIVFARIETAGDTVNVLSVVPGAGSAVFTLSGAVAADTTISFFVVNGN